MLSYHEGEVGLWPSVWPLLKRRSKKVTSKIPSLEMNSIILKAQRRCNIFIFHKLPFILINFLQLSVRKRIGFNYFSVRFAFVLHHKYRWHYNCYIIIIDQSEFEFLFIFEQQCFEKKVYIKNIK